jgi:site-specific DNA recombinase
LEDESGDLAVGSKESEPIIAVKRHTLFVSLGAQDDLAFPSWRKRASENQDRPIAATVVEGNDGAKGVQNERLIQSIVRAHAWKRALLDGAHDSVEMLAAANQLHPKVVRQALRLAFLSPDITSAILEGRQPKGLCRV